MKNTTLLLAAIIGLSAGIPSAAAYNGTVSNVRFGEHPYETRTRDENRRKRIAEDNKRYGYFRFSTPAYFHPIYAKRSTLHPFFRKGGTSQNVNTRYAGWRGYQDPVRAHNLSPDTYCSNFSYQRSQYRGAPLAYHCF